MSSFLKNVSIIRNPGMKRVKIKPIIIFIAIAAFFVYLASSSGNTPYNYFTRLAAAFLKGKYYISSNPAWLSELIPIGINKYAIVYPPGPAILITPLVAIFGQDFPQQVFAHLIGALIVLTASSLAWEITKDKGKTIWVTILSGFGNIIWFMSATGSVWLLGQTTSILFLLLAIYFWQKKNNAFLIGLLLGISFLARVEIILALPFFFFLVERKKKVSLLLGILPMGIIYLLYNYLRFGNFLESGYALIPGVLKEPWYSLGIINPAYIPRNLKVMFGSLPVFSGTFPFVFPSWGGLAIWITTPAFIYSLFAPLKDKSVVLAWLCIILILIIVLMHGENGYAQFGYRFAADIYPFLFFLIIKYLEKNKLRWHHMLLISLSVLVNAWGVIFINRLGFVMP